MEKSKWYGCITIFNKIKVFPYSNPDQIERSFKDKSNKLVIGPFSASTIEEARYITEMAKDNHLGNII